MELWTFFIEKLVIRDLTSCKGENEFLEKQIVNHKGHMKCTRVNKRVYKVTQAHINIHASLQTHTDICI